MKSRRTVLAMLVLAAAMPLHARPTREEDEVSFFRAAQIDDAARIKPILARGLDPNIREPERGETGLIVALRYDAMNVVRLLLAQPSIKLSNSGQRQYRTDDGCLQAEPGSRADAHQAGRRREPPRMDGAALRRGGR